ncbi:MAG: DUF2461 domain-containing protein [Nevskiaceae bacterium]|nr:MAG: DUF2461 domain-containing protein [Nevskiaceae bacterium]TBR73638.1 MAG: DUF2461 domain-containing protein [Nevskiaceae bacterium]
MTTGTCFTPASFAFLRALQAHNDRAWFNAHKQDYLDHVRTPLLDLIAALAAPLAKVSPHFVADPRPQGGCMFRIYRDTRFSHDKRPYKEWASFKLFHERTRELGGAAPLFYLHVQPGQCFVGAGVWHPQRDALLRIRNYLVNNPASWKQIAALAGPRRHFQFGGESLQRPPHGFDPAHELIDDLRRKDFVLHCALPDNVLLAPDLPRQVMRIYRTLAPLNDWLCGALDLDF